MRELIPARCTTWPSGSDRLHIIARENVKALRKDVLAKCYGGDITRKKKLWKAEGRQKAHEAGRQRSKSRRKPFWPSCGWITDQSEIPGRISAPDSFSGGDCGYRLWLYALDVLKFRKRRAKDAKEPSGSRGASFFSGDLIVFVLRSFLSNPSRSLPDR